MKTAASSGKAAVKAAKSVKRVPPKGKPFVKGQSGNPTGRAKPTPEELDLIQACKDKTPGALEVIQELMAGAKSDSVRLGAAVYVIDRAYGKAVQPTDNKHSGTMAISVTNEQAIRIAQEVLRGNPG